MAIGDKPNQNLFGTNYNAEDEEEKKARLAAQGAMMGAGSPTVVGAGNIPALDSNIVAQVPGIQNIRNPGAFDPANMEPARPIMSAGTAGRDERTTLSEYVSQGISSGVEGLRDAVGTESVSMEDYRAAQAAQAASNLEATPSVTPPVERPMAGAQEQPGAVVSPFLQSPDTPSGLGGPLLRGFEMVNDAARGPNAPMGQDATRAALGGMTLNEYLNAPAGTEGVSGLQTDPQGRMITPSAQPPVDSAVAPATAQLPVDALSSFEQDSLSRQQRIGGTGSFEGDSEAREARLRASDRQLGESQADRDTRIAQSRTTGGQTEGLSFDDARRRAEGQLAARGAKNPSASQVNALARALQAGEPERLAELETKRAKDAIELRDAEAKKDFKPQVVEIGDQKLIQLSPSYYQPVRPEPTAEEPFKPRVLEEGGFTYYETAPNRFERQPSTKTGGATGAVSSIIDETIAAGGGVATPAPTVDTPEVATGDEFTPKQEADIQAVMGTNPTKSRAEVIEAMQTQGAL